MAISVSEEQNFLSFSVEGAPTSPSGHALVDLWIKLPKSGKFILFVPRGEILTLEHAYRLSQHSEKKLFVRTQDFAQTRTEDNKTVVSSVRVEPLVDVSQVFNSLSLETQGQRSLGRPLTHELKKIYKDLASPPNLTQLSLEDSYLAKLATRLIDVIAPEVNTVRQNLANTAQFVGVMNDSAVITAIVVYFAMATGQTSPSVFRDFAYACLLMDLSLFDVSRKEQEAYLLDPASVSVAIAEQIEQHPVTSCNLVERRFKNISSSVKHMILGHHELYNGRGYPKRVRSEVNAPVVKILALATDVFDAMKRAQLRGKPISLEQALTEVGFGNQPAHMRRHNFSLCREIRNFMQSPALAA
jgi:response regulator RpfG family c-di-GMP phosphodiesterase